MKDEQEASLIGIQSAFCCYTPITRGWTDQPKIGRGLRALEQMRAYIQLSFNTIQRVYNSAVILRAKFIWTEARQ
jgi:hypothetical protein